MRPEAMTLVVMMGTGAQIDIASALLARGWRPSTPAALVYAASREDSETWTGTLASLQRGDGPMDPARPGTLVIGEVVTLRDVLVESLAGEKAVGAR
jgi:siroheme synthase